MLSTIFKLYDIRGKYPSQINEVVVFDIIRKFPMLFGEKIRVVVGHDARHSSPSLYKTAIKTLQELQYPVFAAGMITTPMLMFLMDQFKDRKTIGITITASHNPKDQNGIKIIDERMRVMGGKELLGRITQSFLDPREVPPARKLKASQHAPQLLKKYAKFLETFFEKKGSSRKLKVVIDCSNGSAGRVLEKIKFPSWVEPILLNVKPDGNFPAHGPNPLEPSATQDVKKAIQKHGADLGAVLDGDGDRVVFVDDRGVRVRPGYIWRLIVGNEKYSRTVVTELNAYLIRKLIADPQMRKVKVFPSRVGRLSFLQEMKDNNADFGFENSGHFYFKEFFYSDCGILTLIKVIQALRALPYSLSDFIEFLPQTVRLPEYDISASHASPALYHTLADMMEKEATRVSFFEGVSLYVDGTFVNVRISNTEGTIRVNVEGEDQKKVKALLKKTTSLVKEMSRWRR